MAQNQNKNQDRGFLEKVTQALNLDSGGVPGAGGVYTMNPFGKSGAATEDEDTTIGQKLKQMVPESISNYFSNDGTRETGQEIGEKLKDIPMPGQKTWTEKAATITTSSPLTSVESSDTKPAGSNSD